MLTTIAAVFSALVACKKKIISAYAYEISLHPLFLLVFVCPLTLMKLSSLGSETRYKMFIMCAKCFKVILTFPSTRFTRKASVFSP